MSFRCHYCRAPGQSGETPNVYTKETRSKSYPSGTVGSEIVKEVLLCGDCWEKVQKPKPGTIGDKVAQT